MSPMPNFSDDDLSPDCSDNSKSIVNTTNNITNTQSDTATDIPIHCDAVNASNVNGTNSCPLEIGKEVLEAKKPKEIDELTESHTTELGTEVTEADDADLKNDNIHLNGYLADEKKNGKCAETLTDANMEYLSQMSTEQCGFPLQIFSHGYLCLPYLSLPYMDLLSDVNVRGYVVGATNVLFKQKRQLYDILVDIEMSRIECHDLELRKLLHLTTEDLRFADYVLKYVTDDKHDVFVDGVGWKGGDEWIRLQFRVYLLCLLRTSMLQGMCCLF